jgi:hypothetical protein
MTDDHMSVSAPPDPAGAPRDAGLERVRSARRWAVGVLVVATLVLAAYLALVLVAVWFVGSAMEALSSRDLGSLDVAASLLKAVPGLLAGWAAGLSASMVLARGEALDARAAGLCSGVLGALVGAVVLALTGVI